MPRRQKWVFYRPRGRTGLGPRRSQKSGDSPFKRKSPRGSAASVTESRLSSWLSPPRRPPGRMQDRKRTIPEAVSVRHRARGQWQPGRVAFLRAWEVGGRNFLRFSPASHFPGGSERPGCGRFSGVFSGPSGEGQRGQDPPPLLRMSRDRRDAGSAGAQTGRTLVAGPDGEPRAP